MEREIKGVRLRSFERQKPLGCAGIQQKIYSSLGYGERGTKGVRLRSFERQKPLGCLRGGFAPS